MLNVLSSPHFSYLSSHAQYLEHAPIVSYHQCSSLQHSVGTSPIYTGIFPLAHVHRTPRLRQFGYRLTVQDVYSLTSPGDGECAQYIRFLRSNVLPNCLSDIDTKWAHYETAMVQLIPIARGCVVFAIDHGLIFGQERILPLWWITPCPVRNLCSRFADVLCKTSAPAVWAP